jgi:hypothetical protein
LGGKGADEASALAIHPQTGDVYVAGVTDSEDFPKTTGGAQAAYGGLYDAFVARLNKELTQILQSTYIGGSYTDWANALAIHPKTGEVYVAGWTHSDNFPRTTGGAQANKNEDSDAFVARLNKELIQILQATYLGGDSIDGANALAIHPRTREVYVAGGTVSYDFPKTTGGAQTECNECYIGRIDVIGDAFVARLTANLAATGGSDGGSGSGGRSGGCAGGGSGCSTTGSASSMAGLWNILVWLSVPAFMLARRIRRR